MKLAVTEERSIDKRTLLILLGVEVSILLLALCLPHRVVLWVLAFSVGIPFFLSLPVYPQIIFPMMIVATALDFGGIVVRGVKILGSIETPVTAFHFAGGAAIVFCAANILWGKRTLLPRLKVTAPLILFLSLIGISTLYAPQRLAAAFNFFRMLFLSLILFVTVILIQNKKHLTLVLVSFIGCAAVTAGMGIYQVITSHYFLPAELIHKIGVSFSRATGTFTNPNAFATFLMAATVVCFALLINLKLSRPVKTTLGVVFLVLVVGLITSFSRANWLATAVGLFLVALFSHKIRALVPIFVILLCIILITGLLSANFRNLVLGRFTSIFNLPTEFKSSARISGAARIYLVEAALSMFLHHPLLGIGTRGFPELFDKYKPAGYPIWCPVRECHTYLATVLAELGIVGFIVFLWFIVVVIREGIKGIRSISDRYLKVTEMGLVAVFVAYQVNMLFTAYIRDNFFWLLTGLLFATKEIGQRLNRPESQQ